MFLKVLIYWEKILKVLEPVPAADILCIQKAAFGKSCLESLDPPMEG